MSDEANPLHLSYSNAGKCKGNREVVGKGCVSGERQRNTILSKNVELNHTCTILMTIRDCLLLKLRSDGYTLVQQKKIKTVDVTKQSEKYVIEAVCTNHGSSH